MKLEWEAGFIIEAEIDQNSVIIKANSEGLISLANHLLALAQAEVPHGYHLHLDDSNSLEPGSSEIILEKM